MGVRDNQPPADGEGEEVKIEETPADGEEHDGDGAPADGEGEAEDLSGLKSALGRVKADRAKLKDENSKLKAENAFLRSVPRGLKNPRAARALASEFGLLKEDGALDVAAFQKQFPEQFTSTSSANAGEGTQSPAPRTGSMNAWIRQKAGRK